MDKEGIGTDATMATHIGTIQQRGYAVCDHNLFFSATEVSRRGRNRLQYFIGCSFPVSAVDCNVV
jgi:DNA topoisomerase IA